MCECNATNLLTLVSYVRKQYSTLYRHGVVLIPWAFSIIYSLMQKGSVSIFSPGPLLSPLLVCEKCTQNDEGCRLLVCFFFFCISYFVRACVSRVVGERGGGDVAAEPATFMYRIETVVCQRCASLLKAAEGVDARLRKLVKRLAMAS